MTNFSIFSLSILFSLSALNLACSSKQNSSDQAQRAGKDVVLKSVHNSGVSGSLDFVEKDASLHISGLISGLEPGLHGFHVRASGNCSEGALSSNPQIFSLPGQIHGVPGQRTSSIGILSNIRADERGQAVIRVNSTNLCLKASKECSVLGRSIVITSREDNFQTQPRGHSGHIVACAPIQ